MRVDFVKPNGVPERISVIRFSALGDCVLLCPLLEHVKAHGVAEVTVITKLEFAELFTAACGVDRVVALGQDAGWRGLRQIIEAHRRDGHCVVDAHNTLRSRVVARGLGGAEATLRKYYLERLGLILFKRATNLPPMSARYGALGKQLGLPEMTARAGGIEIPAEVEERAGDLLSGDRRFSVSIAPGSRWPSKQWGVDKFVSLARRFIDRFDCRIVLVGDERDAPAAARIAAAVGDRAENLAGRTSILESAAAIRRTSGLVGNDSGLMHLAEAVGVPTVAVFGPTVEAFGYYPSLPRSKVVERDISCRPCSRNGSRRCPKGTVECLTGIDVAAVERAFSDLVAGEGPNRYILE